MKEMRVLSHNTNGIVHVQNAQVVSGRVIRDRLGLKARLQKAAP